MTTLETLSCQPAKPALADDFASFKRQQQATWASGAFAVIGTTLQFVGETLAEVASVRAGARNAARHAAR